MRISMTPIKCNLASPNWLVCGAGPDRPTLAWYKRWMYSSVFQFKIRIDLPIYSTWIDSNLFVCWKEICRSIRHDVFVWVYGQSVTLVVIFECQCTSVQCTQYCWIKPNWIENWFPWANWIQSEFIFLNRNAIIHSRCNTSYSGLGLEMLIWVATTIFLCCS